MVFTDHRQTGVRDGKVLYTIESGQSSLYLAKKEMRLKDFRFQEYDATGTEVSTGEADSAVIDTASNDATITGRLRAHSTDRGASLEVNGGQAGALTWANEDRILRSGPDATVILTKDDGSRVDARRLTLNLNSNRLELQEGVQGSWTSETKSNAVAPDTPVAVSHAPRP